MTKREEFLLENERFFEAGFIREIYANDEVSILNVCNSLYAATKYQKVDNSKHLATLVGIEQIKEIVNDNIWLLKWMANLSHEDMKTVLMEFNDRTFEVMKGIKEQTDVTGPTQYIDLELEENLEKLRWQQPQKIQSTIVSEKVFSDNIIGRVFCKIFKR